MAETLRLPHFELRAQALAAGREFELWQLPSPATPRFESVELTRMRKGRALELGENPALHLGLFTRTLAPCGASTASARYAVLAPSFDHASRLGEMLSDDERRRRLESPDTGYQVAAYVRRARSALYRSETDAKPVSPLEAFRLAGERFPRAAVSWHNACVPSIPSFSRMLSREFPSGE